MNPDPKKIIGRKHQDRLNFLGNLLADKFILEILPPDGLEINTWDSRERFTYGEDLDPSIERPCFYSKGCPNRVEHAGFYEVVQTLESGKTSFFLHMECAKDLAYKVSSGENP